MADNLTPQVQNRNASAVLSVSIVLTVVTIVIIFIILLSSCLFLRSRRGVNGTRGPAPQDGVVIEIEEAALDSSCPKIIYSEKTSQSLKSGDSDQEVESCCSICLSDYKESEIVRVISDCGHMFHAVCIDQWLPRHATCPVCRISPQNLSSPVPQRTTTRSLTPRPTPSITFQLEVILASHI